MSLGDLPGSLVDKEIGLVTSLFSYLLVLPCKENGSVVLSEWEVSPNMTCITCLGLSHILSAPFIIFF